MVNFPRGFAEIVGAWLIDLIDHRRGSLHYDRIVDQIGQDRLRTIQGPGVVPYLPTALLPNGQQRAAGSLKALSGGVEQAATILTVDDTFLILGALTMMLMVIVLLLPTRTLPPRLEFASE